MQRLGLRVTQTTLGAIDKREGVVKDKDIPCGADQRAILVDDGKVLESHAVKDGIQFRNSSNRVPLRYP